MTNPGSGFQSGDDFIAARVSIDVPTEGIAGLREITQEMDRFRTSVEAANRSSETFSGYLERIAEAASQAASATENMVSILEQTSSYQNQAAVGGGVFPQVNAPPQYSDPFSGQNLGMGMGMGGGGGSAGVGDINTQLDALRTQNPRAYVNKMAASGQYRMGDIPATSPSGMDIQNAANRISERTALMNEGAVGPDGVESLGSRSGRMGAIAQQVMSEISPGGIGAGGIGGVIQRGLGGIGRMGADGLLGGLGMGGLGSIAAAAGPIAAVAGTALAGYGLIQGAGGIYQDYKNMGSVRGGGAAEGVGYEMSIRAMAMNPFISGDQSRQIVQQGLRDGYTGKEFDTITSMVATNLKDFNMEVGESFKLLRKSILEGGQSGAGFMSDMESLKQLSAQGGYMSLPNAQQGYSRTKSDLIDMGMSGAAAGQSAALGQYLYNDNAVLAGTAGDVATDMLNSPAGRAALRYQGGLSVPPGLLPGAMASAMEPGASTAASNQALRTIAMQVLPKGAKEGDVSYLNARYLFGRRARSLGVRLSDNELNVMFDGFARGDDPLKKAQDELQQNQTEQTKVQNRNPLAAAVGSFEPLVNQVPGMWDTAVQGVGAIGDLFSEDPGANLSKRWNDYKSRQDERGQSGYDSSATKRIPMLTSIQNSYGHSGYEVLDKGKVINFDTRDEEQLNKLSSGEYRWRPKGDKGSGYTLQETPAGGDLKQFAGGKTEVSGSVVITFKDGAERMLTVQGGNRVPLTAHEQQANAGANQATPNNAPIGEGRRP